MSDNTNSATANAVTYNPNQHNGAGATWFKEYISADNVDNIDVDYFGKIIGLLNY